MKKILPYILAISMVIAFLIGCEADNPPSVFDPDKIGEPTPEIMSIIPSDSSLAGIGEITIIGRNFSPIAESNLVYFDKTRATVLSSSETEIKVKTPNIIGDSINIKIAVQQAYLFSNIKNYKLIAAVWEFGGFNEYDDAYALACDSDENLYVSIKGKKIIKVTPDGERQVYSPDAGFDKASGMKMGPGGYLYFVNILSYIFRVPPEGGKYEVFTALPGGAFDLDFDVNGNLYCGGSGNAIYRVKQDKSNEVVAEYANVYIRSVRVFNDYVYIAGEYTGTDPEAVKRGVWRNKILSAEGTLGENELVLNWDALFKKRLLSINFSADGEMYVGTDAPEAIVVFQEDGSYEGLYPGVIQPESYALCWGNGPFLYVSRRGENPAQKRVIKMNMLKNGAPYYGRQ